MGGMMRVGGLVGGPRITHNGKHGHGWDDEGGRVGGAGALGALVGADVVLGCFSV